MQLVKPKGLKQGDTVATISLSWGGAGDLPHRYKVGKHQIESIFDLNVVETTNGLRSAQWIYDNPKARAEDLMEAFRNSDIKAIISNIGGEDSIRLLKYIDLNVIRDNPKIFIGFSDSTVTHFMCLKAGLSSFYGTSVLVGFAENGGMHKYQVEDIKRTLFCNEAIGEIHPNKEGWTTEYLDWFDTSLQHTKRKLTPSNGWRFLRGESKVQGSLIGGCLEVLDMIKGTIIWPELEVWRGAILFLESSEEKPDPKYVRYWLMGFAAMGILNVINGIIVGRPYDNEFVQEYDDVILQVLNEEGLYSLPVITQMDFGHTCPTFTLPYGRIAEIDCKNKTFSILENAVD
ncbi:peptidase S66 [Myroides marinus]|uniref:S66 family peptidase n=1 Tax=Myroides marinus TaxID=703342 RepID=UPI00074219BF|nr:S66 peptidase family protein [Myroides marinus]KUF43394.1 peptidase S66 [Myroides marinus]